MATRDAPTGGDWLVHELRGLAAVSAAVAGADRFEEVLEVAADQTLRVLGAASVSLNRWEREAGRLRTLVNVGRLGPGEERWPADEVYELERFPLSIGVLERGEAHVTRLDDPSLSPGDRALLETLEKTACAAVPIIVAGSSWGELEVFFMAGQDLPDTRDVLFMRAVAEQVAIAIGRAELFAAMEQEARRDPLTGVLNRRGVDLALAASVAAARLDGTPLSLLFCDLDDLKAINDEEGHGAGDAAIVRAARALEETAAGHPGALVGRLGGDELCVILPGTEAEEARAFGLAVARALSSGTRPQTLSTGVASLSADLEDAEELFRAADAAQYAAKRAGAGRVVVAGEEALGPVPPRSRRRRVRDRPRAAPLDAPARLEALRRAGVLDTAPEETFDRLTRVAQEALGVPVVLLTLVDGERQFFKSQCGLAEPWATRRATPLSHSFCRHVALSGTSLAVVDARRHELVRGNPAVGELGMVAYLGVPLALRDGHVLGALCAIDHEPHAWGPEDESLLEAVAGAATAELDLRRALGASDLAALFAA